ncbi:hypothetical protein [Streptomyces sp. CBMA123]|uniref:hypothetical protein n=1 Tax=Streptomyces sp. CBMA123 TaxID=1896313 RepID=UPI001661CA14|nr:hypothetical protein [Streptomyces sp. CBMA123]MBD0692945.1 hypothetical protein [Streptomyces sp. CBMA123]
MALNAGGGPARHPRRQHRRRHRGPTATELGFLLFASGSAVVVLLVVTRSWGKWLYIGLMVLGVLGVGAIDLYRAWRRRRPGPGDQV